MPPPTRHFHRIAALHGQVDPSDSEAVQHWYIEVLPTLPRERIEEILELLLQGDPTVGVGVDEGTDATEPEPSYPRGAPLPSLSSSPPAPVSLFAVGWRGTPQRILAALLRRAGRD